MSECNRPLEAPFVVFCRFAGSFLGSAGNIIAEDKDRRGKTFNDRVPCKIIWRPPWGSCEFVIPSTVLLDFVCFLDSLPKE